MNPDFLHIHFHWVVFLFECFLLLCHCLKIVLNYYIWCIQSWLEGSSLNKIVKYLHSKVEEEETK